jgi:cytochrome c biogenesis protein CcmG, thiol:disulfide interchange protein DsbE
MFEQITRLHIAAGAGFLGGLVLGAMVASAEEPWPSIQVGSEVYSNVTITSVTATDVYFNHARGLGSAKLKNLSPQLQKHFGFNAAKAGELEKKQREQNAQFRAEIATRDKAAARAAASQVEMDDDGNVVVPKLYARSYLNQRPPRIFAEEWLTPPPDVTGKFVLVVILTGWADQCRAAIPHLNSLQARFKDRFVVVGISNETLENLKKLTSPRVEFAFGTDPQSRTWNMLEVQAIPHSILIDPKGTVRWEGVPLFLTEKGLERLMDRCSE